MVSDNAPPVNAVSCSARRCVPGYVAAVVGKHERGMSVADGRI